jgi:RNA polymerase sigma-70 factor (ECF subfamily)
MGTTLDEFIPTRQSLLNRLKDWNDQQSWWDFFETYGPVIYRVARQAGLADAEAQDAVQETVISVAEQMPHFQYDPARGSFRGWLLQITQRRIADQLRRKYYQKDGQSLPKEETLHTSIVEGQPGLVEFSLEDTWNDEWEQNLRKAAIARVKKRADPRHYQIYHLHVLRNLPAKEVARRLRVKVSEVYYAKYKIAALIKREARLLEKKGI